MVVFVVMHFVPGGPVERQIMRYKMAAMTEGGAGGGLPAVAVAPGRCDRGNPTSTTDSTSRCTSAISQWLGNVVATRSRKLVHLPGSGVGRHQVAVSRFRSFSDSPGFLLSYLVCVPLGVLKAVRHGAGSTSSRSVLVFLGYSVPGWALGTVLLVLFGGGSFWNVFPLGGFRPDNWEYLGFLARRSRSRLGTWRCRSSATWSGRLPR